MKGWQPQQDEASRQKGIKTQQEMKHGDSTIGGYIYKCEACGGITIGAEPPPKGRYLCWYHRLKKNSNKSQSEIE